jgi:hypothetical protein
MEIQIQRKEIQIFRNDIQGGHNKIQIRRNEIQIQIPLFPSPNRAFSSTYADPQGVIAQPCIGGVWRI